MSKLACPFCKRRVTVPTQDGLVYWCQKEGVACPQTVYMLVMVEAGRMPSEITAIQIMYKELAGVEWDARNPELPDYQVSRQGFILRNGEVVKKIPEGQEVFWGVTFMRLLESKKVPA